MSPKLTTLVFLPLFCTKNWHADLEFACKFCFLVILVGLWEGYALSPDRLGLFTCLYIANIIEPF